MANLIQATVYQIDGNPLPSPITLDFQTSDILVNETSINIPAVNSAIQVYNVPNNELGFKTYYVSESVSSLTSVANAGVISFTQATVLEVGSNPQIPGGFQYSFPSQEIVISETINPTTGVNATITYKNVNYAVSETQATLYANSNLINFVINEQGVPSFYAATLANIPAPGEAGRMFVSTDTFAIYRDTGVSWDLIGGPGSGTITGSGTANYISKFSGSSVIGNSQIFDNGTSVGINTITPSSQYKLDVNGNLRGVGTIWLTNTITSAVGAFSHGAFGTDIVFGSWSANTPIFFVYNSSPRMRLGGTTSGIAESVLTVGNVSNSTAPWVSTSYTLALGVYASLENNNESSTSYSYNAYRSSGGLRYIASNPSLSFGLDFNKFAWRSAASGTSGNLITFTESMTLDLNGRLGLGVTSPTDTFDVALGTAGRIKLRSSFVTDADAYISAPFGNFLYGTNIYYVQPNFVYGKNGYGVYTQMESTTGTFTVLTAPLNGGGAGAIATPVGRMTIFNNGNVVFNKFADAGWKIDIAATTDGLRVTGGGTTSATSGLKVETSGGISNFQVLDNGNCGIRVSSPTARLHISTGGATTTSLGLKVRNSADSIDILSTFGTSQVIINSTSGSLSTSAQLQIDSTTRGFLPPRMTATQAEAIATPATGLMVYSTDGTGVTITTAGWWGYDGATWVKLN